MSRCRFCDCNPCMCGKHDYPNYTCRTCGYTPCICGTKDYENEKKVEYDPTFSPNYDYE